jgi:elongation factor G
VLCGSAFKNKGVQPLLDAVIDYLPSPIDVPAIKGIEEGRGRGRPRHPADETPLRRPRLQDHQRPVTATLTFVRVYSACSKPGRHGENTVKDKRERIGRMFQMHANSARRSRSLSPATSSPSSASRTPAPATRWRSDKPVILERMEFPEPVIDIAVEPKTKADQEKMTLGLQKLAGEDPSFRVDRPGERPDHHQGHGRAAPRDHRRPHEARVQGRRQYRRAAGGLPRDHHQAAHRDDYTHKKQTGGSGQFAEVKIVFEPNERGKGFEFENGSSAARCRRNTSRASRRASSRSRPTPACSPASRCRLQVHAGRRRLPRRRLERAGLRDRRRACFREA